MPPLKIEVLVLGGTWDNYPLEYQNEFIRDIYYSINTLEKRENITKQSLKEEIILAQKSKKRIIGLTLETRPDYINIKQIITNLLKIHFTLKQKECNRSFIYSAIISL